MHYGKRPGHFQTPNYSISYKLGSEWVSERMSAAERAKKASKAEQANEWVMQANKGMDKRVALYLVLTSRFMTVLNQSAMAGWSDSLLIFYFVCLIVLIRGQYIFSDVTDTYYILQERTSQVLVQTDGCSRVISRNGVDPKKSLEWKWRKNALNNEDDLAESWKFSTCTTTSWEIFLQKNIFLILLYIADIAILMSNSDNFDINQISSKFVQRYCFYCSI